ncbi:MAG: PTS sugar transporter subunit IIA [Gammaproteobacteria bacterium]|nr:PTS sugar transporter subunit IIA [Gammaproteobacteria bacterium]
MNLSQILSVERIAVDVVAASKKRVLEEIASRLSKPGLALSEVLTSLTGREKLGSTGLGHGVAIPHGRLPSVDASLGAFIRLRNPVDYAAHDGQPVDLVFGLLVPQNATGDHLKHLAAIAEKLSDEVFCEKTRAATDAAALYALLTH